MTSRQPGLGALLPHANADLLKAASAARGLLPVSAARRKRAPKCQRACKATNLMAASCVCPGKIRFTRHGAVGLVAQRGHSRAYASTRWPCESPP